MTAATVASLLAGLAIIITLARLLGGLMRRLGQPAVIGEILAGVLLGPTFFGVALAGHLFPKLMVRPALGGIGDLGLVVFMFIVGYELDHKLVRASSRAAVTVSLGSIAVPLALGTVLGLWLAHQQHITRPAPFALFIGVASAITAFPVLARILTDRGMQRTRVGTLALASAAIDDVSAWTLLAIVVVVAKSGSSGEWRVLLVPVYAALMALVVRPLLRRLADLRNRYGRLTPDVLAVVVVGLLASAYATEWMGLNFIFGAFLFGVVMPRAGFEQFRLEILERLEQMAVLVLLPVYFVLAGLNVDLSGFGRQSAVDLVLILAVAIAGKFGGAYLAGRLRGVPARRAGALATLMNTRGLTEIVILTTGLQLGILNVQLYSLMVVMALATTAMTGPLLNVVYPPRLVQREIEESDRALLGDVAYRVLAATGGSDADAAVLTVGTALLVGRDQGQLVISTLLPYRTERLEIGTGLSAELVEMADRVAELEAAAMPSRALGIDASALARFSADPAADLVELATSARVNALVMSTLHPDYQAVARSVPVRLVTTAALVPSSWTTVVVRFGSGVDAQVAVEVGMQLAAAQAARVLLDPGGLSGRRLDNVVNRIRGAGLTVEVSAQPTADALIVSYQGGPQADAHLIVRAEPDYVADDSALVVRPREPQEVS